MTVSDSTAAIKPTRSQPKYTSGKRPRITENSFWIVYKITFTNDWIIHVERAKYNFRNCAISDGNCKRREIRVAEVDSRDGWRVCSGRARIRVTSLVVFYAQLPCSKPPMGSRHNRTPVEHKQKQLHRPGCKRATAQHWVVMTATVTGTETEIHPI